MKKIHANALKTLKVLKQILKKINLEKDAITSAVFKRIQGIEDNDSIEEIYARRVGMKDYFK